MRPEPPGAGAGGRPLCLKLGRSDLRMSPLTLRTLLLLVTLVALHPVRYVGAQAAQDTTAFPEVADIATRYRAMVDSAASAEARLARLSDLDELRGELREMRARIDRLNGLVAGAEAEYLRPERLSRLRDRALQHEQRLASVYERVGERLQTVDEVRIGWAERLSFWRGWR